MNPCSGITSNWLPFPFISVPVCPRLSPTPDRVAIALQSMNIIPRLRLAEL